MVLIDGKPQIQQLKLSVISVQQVPPSGAVLTSPAHVLPQSVESRAFFLVAVRVVAVRLADVALERGDPVNLICLLQRDGDHGSED